MKQTVRFLETWRFYRCGDIVEVETPVAEGLVRKQIAEVIGLPHKAITEATPERMDKMVRSADVPNKSYDHHRREKRRHNR